MKKTLLFKINYDRGNKDCYWDTLICQNFVFNAQKTQVVSSTKYHEPELTYTGATVGSVHVGGWEYSKEYCTHNFSSSDKGDLSFKSEDKCMRNDGSSYSLDSYGTIYSIVFCEEIAKIVASNPVLKSIFNVKTSTLYLHKQSSSFIGSMETWMHTSDTYRKALAYENVSSELNNLRCTYQQCLETKKILLNAISGMYTSEEEKIFIINDLLNTGNPYSIDSMKNHLKYITLKNKQQIYDKAEKVLTSKKSYKFLWKTFYSKTDCNDYSSKIFGISIILFFLLLFVWYGCSIAALC